MEEVLYIIYLTAMDSHAITSLLRVGGLGDMPPEKRVEMLSKNESGGRLQKKKKWEGRGREIVSRAHRGTPTFSRGKVTSSPLAAPEGARLGRAARAGRAQPAHAAYPRTGPPAEARARQGKLTPDAVASHGLPRFIRTSFRLPNRGCCGDPTPARPHLPPPPPSTPAPSSSRGGFRRPRLPPNTHPPHSVHASARYRRPPPPRLVRPSPAAIRPAPEP